MVVKDKDVLPNTSTIPNLALDIREFKALRQQIQGRSKRVYFIIGSIQRTPITKFSRKEVLLSLTFPTLYLTSTTDFIQPRQREVDYLIYIRYIITYINGQFARYSRFQFTIFNTLLRKQTTNTTSFFINQVSSNKPITIDDIRNAFNSLDSSISLVNILVRYSAKIRGIQLYQIKQGSNLQAIVSRSSLIPRLIPYTNLIILGLVAIFALPIYYLFYYRLLLV